MKEKLMSRKFWLAIASFFSGTFMMFGYSETAAQTIAGAIVAIGGAVGYMVAEGIVDAKKVGYIFDTIIDTVEELDKEA